MDKSKKTNRRPKCAALEGVNATTVLLAIYDAMMAGGAYFLALWLRFDCRFTEIPNSFLMSWAEFTPLYIVLSLAVFQTLHLYQSLWKFASFTELKRTVIASVVLGVAHALVITLLFQRMPISYYLMGAVFQFGFSILIRFGYRFAVLERGRQIRKMQKNMQKMIQE